MIQNPPPPLGRQKYLSPPPPPVKNYVWRVYSGLNGVRPEPWDAGRQKNGVASGGAGKTERQQNRLR